MFIFTWQLIYMQLKLKPPATIMLYIPPWWQTPKQHSCVFEENHNNKKIQYSKYYVSHYIFFLSSAVRCIALHYQIDRSSIISAFTILQQQIENIQGSCGNKSFLICMWSRQSKRKYNWWQIWFQSVGANQDVYKEKPISEYISFCKQKKVLIALISNCFVFAVTKKSGIIRKCLLKEICNQRL